jgi:hypothetical protein
MLVSPEVFEEQGPGNVRPVHDSTTRLQLMDVIGIDPSDNRVYRKRIVPFHRVYASDESASQFDVETDFSFVPGDMILLGYRKQILSMRTVEERQMYATGTKLLQGFLLSGIGADEIQAVSYESVVESEGRLMPAYIRDILTPRPMHEVALQCWSLTTEIGVAFNGLVTLKRLCS